MIKKLKTILIVAGSIIAILLILFGLATIRDLVKANQKLREDLNSFEKVMGELKEQVSKPVKPQTNYKPAPQAPKIEIHAKDPTGVCSFDCSDFGREDCKFGLNPEPILAEHKKQEKEEAEKNKPKFIHKKLEASIKGGLKIDNSLVPPETPLGWYGRAEVDGPWEIGGDKFNGTTEFAGFADHNSRMGFEIGIKITARIF